MNGPSSFRRSSAPPTDLHRCAKQSALAQHHCVCEVHACGPTHCRGHALSHRYPTALHPTPAARCAHAGRQQCRAHCQRPRPRLAVVVPFPKFPPTMLGGLPPRLRRRRQRRRGGPRIRLQLTHDVTAVPHRRRKRGAPDARAGAPPLATASPPLLATALPWGVRVDREGPHQPRGGRPRGARAGARAVATGTSRCLAAATARTSHAHAHVRNTPPPTPPRAAR